MKPTNLACQLPPLMNTLLSGHAAAKVKSGSAAWPRAAIALAVASALASPVHAANRYWACTDASGLWSTTCWSAASGGAATLGQPQLNDKAYLNNASTTNRTVIYDASTSNKLSYLEVNASNAGSMTLSQSAQTLAVVDEYIGTTGTGAVTQSGGTHTVSNTLRLGTNSSGNGSYTLSGTGILNSDYQYIGNDGIGTFIQTGGTNNNNSAGTGKMFLGAVAGSQGTYILSGGTLKSASQTIGSSGTGTFIQSGGTNTNTFTILGSSASGSGTYNMNGGTHNSDRILFGQGSSPLTSGSGVYNLNGGILNLGTIVDNSGRGIFNLNGGTLNLVGSTSSISVQTFNIGEASGAIGNFTLDGAKTIQTTNETIGKSGIGTLTQNGGTHTVSNTLTLGQNAGSNGTYNLNGGTLNVGTIAKGSGTAAFNWTAGTLNFTQAHTIGAGALFNSLDLGAGKTLGATTLTVAATGALNLKGGTLNVGNLVKGGDTAAFNWTAGTLNFTQAHTIGAGALFNSLDLGAGKTLGATTLTVAATGALNINAGGTANVSNNLINEGQINSTGALTSANETIGQSGAGTFTQSGGTHTVSNTLTLGQNAGSNGTYNLNGGTLQATNIANGAGAGTLNMNGGKLINAGSFDVDTLNVGQASYLTGSAGKVFHIRNTFDNQSTQNALWNTSAASLSLDGTGSHILTLAGADLGAVSSGYSNNFAWGKLSVNGSVSIFDGNSTAGAALYVGVFDLGNDLSLLSSIYSDYNIYYDASQAGNSYLGGLTYALNGAGHLIGVTSVPVPAAAWLFGSSLLGLAGFARQRKSA